MSGLCVIVLFFILDDLSYFCGWSENRLVESRSPQPQCGAANGLASVLTCYPGSS